MTFISLSHLQFCALDLLLQGWFSLLWGHFPSLQLRSWRVNMSSEFLPEQQRCCSPVSCSISLHSHNCTLGIAQSLASHYASVTKPLLFSLLTHKISPLYPQLPLEFSNQQLGNRHSLLCCIPCCFLSHWAADTEVFPFRPTQHQFLAPIISSTNLYKVILKQKFFSTLFIWLKLARKITGCLWCVWTAGLGNSLKSSFKFVSFFYI